MKLDDLDCALGAMGADVDAADPAARADARRRRVVAHLQRVNSDFAADARNARWRRWATAGGLMTGVAAAVALLLLGSLSTKSTGSRSAVASVAARSTFVPLRSEMTQGSVLHRMEGRSEHLGLGDSPVLRVSDVLETEDGSRARLHGGRGLDIEIGPASRVVLGQVEQTNGAAQLRLERGRVNCSVDPTGEGAKLSVVTPDATVEVKGTVFSVEVMGDAENSRTCVRVQRGLVSVNRAGRLEQLAAGESSGCEAVVSDLATEETDKLQKDSAVVQQREASEDGEPSSRAVSSLATQNGLFARGLAAERRGQLDVAQRELTELLSRFPETPLRSDVEAALSRIVARRQER